MKRRATPRGMADDRSAGGYWMAKEEVIAFDGLVTECASLREREGAALRSYLHEGLTPP